MAYNINATRNMIVIRERVLKIHKELENKEIKHIVHDTTIIVDGIKFQGHRQLGILEKMY